MSELSTADVAVLEQAEMRAWASLFAAAPAGLVEALGLEARWFGPALGLLSRAIDVGQFNRIQGVSLPGDEDGASIETAVDWYRQAGSKNFLIQIPPGPGDAEFEAKAMALGLTRFRRAWTKFRRPPIPVAVPLTELEIVLAGPDQAADFGAAAAAGFGMPPPLATWLAALVGRPDWRCYVSYDGDRAVGAGACWVDDGLAWIGIGATRPEGRGRGSQSAILARRINDAVEEGASLIVTETGLAVSGEPQTSYSNILKAGFEVAYERPNWTEGTT
jgi:hypothetical protein